MPENISTKDVKELRDKTGAGIMECNNALRECKGDVTKASEWLKRKGLVNADKKKDRVTKSGYIGSYIHANGKIGVLIEVACESDFVAKNEKFQEMIKELCLQITAMSPVVVSREDLSQEMLQKEREFYAQEMKGKPPQMVEKIVEGKLEKLFYNQKCLLEQPYVKDDKIKIIDLVKNCISQFGENIVVKRFVRFELGKYE
ncbi:MAG: translation elongation factor Ts [Candidatus Brocadiia bacterium]